MGDGMQGNGTATPGLGRSGTLLAWALLGLWAAACLWFPLTDTDIWWHLAAARWMGEHGMVPRVDPFATSSLGTPWVDLHWGYQLLSLGFWKAGGAAALLTAKVAAVFAAVVLALRPPLRPSAGAVLLPAAALGLFQVRFFLDVRPLALTLLGLAALHFAVLSHLEGRLRRPWLVLVPVQIVLANLQGLYPLGACLVTCLLLGAWWSRRRDPGVPLRSLAWTTAALWLAGFATPYGWAGFALPLKLLARITPTPGNVFSSEIAENLPLTALAAREPLALVPWILLLGFALWTFRRAPFSLGHALILAGFGALACMAQRNLPLLLLAVLFAASRNLKATPASLTERNLPGILSRTWAPSALVLAVALFGAPKIRMAWAYELPGSLETPFRFPRGAVDFLEAHPVPGRIFNELRFGGYLAWRLPEVKPYVDGRMVLRDDAFYREFLSVVDDPAGFPAYASERDFTYALLPIGEDRRFLPLAAALLGREGWTLAYCDGAAALLIRPDIFPATGTRDDVPAGLETHRREAAHRFGSNRRLRAIAERNIADLYRAAGLAIEEPAPNAAPPASS